MFEMRLEAENPVGTGAQGQDAAHIVVQVVGPQSRRIAQHDGKEIEVLVRRATGAGSPEFARQQAAAAAWRGTDHVELSWGCLGSEIESRILEGMISGRE